MDCTLYIPHLIPPCELAAALWRTVDAPQLKAMLTRAAHTADADSGRDAGLCRTFGISRQQDWPLAPLLARHAHLNAPVDESGYWLCATPVHLETRRNALVLTDPALLEITAEASAAMALTLANHLRDENITLHAPHAGVWFVRCDVAPVMSTTSLATAIGRDVRPFLPQGKDGARWHRTLTEMQMLLHSHPVNDARESRGLLPVNSVWLWGGGTLPAPAPKAFDRVWSDDATVRALAHHGSCHIESQPERVITPTLGGTSHFFSFEALEPLMRRGDVQSWSNAVSALNRDWFTPLAAALKSGTLDTLTLSSINDAGTQHFVVRRSDMLKFWRQNKYLK